MNGYLSLSESLPWQLLSPATAQWLWDAAIHASPWILATVAALTLLAQVTKGRGHSARGTDSCRVAEPARSTCACDACPIRNQS